MVLDYKSTLMEPYRKALYWHMGRHPDKPDDPNKFCLVRYYLRVSYVFSILILGIGLVEMVPASPNAPPPRGD